MMRTTFVALCLLSPLLPACTVGEVDTVPVAPSGLTATPVSGAVHLTWKDNSVDEIHFMVMRMMHGHDTEMTAIGTANADVTEYHDATVESGMTYMYIVGAMSDGGESDSNEVQLAVP